MASELHLTDDQRRAVEEFRQRHRTGVLALLFTDVVGSIDLKQRLGDAAGNELIQRHRSTVREHLASSEGGEEISTAGDSFFIVFAKPSAAVRFALRLQNVLHSLGGQDGADVQVRIGVHMGEVFIEEKGKGALEGDVLGLQVDTASRVMSLGAGGQVLMTRGVFDNARAILKGEALADLAPLSWLSHGFYSVKGIEEPTEICEVGEGGRAPLQPPPDSPGGYAFASPDREPVLGWRPALEQTVPNTEWGLQEKLGEGGFGEVWLARHRRTKEPRVFKFCFRADRLRSLKREMTLFRALREVLGDRQDIARLLNVQFEEAPYYIEVEYSPGGDLISWIDRQGGVPNVPMGLRLEIVAQAATALAAAHSAGILHKDVKPSNILIEEKKDGTVQVRLTDFGIGQLQDRMAILAAGITAAGFTETVGALTELASHTGTHLYMAPELIAGREPSVQSDVYSLGVLLYQLIIGDLSQPMTTDWESRVRDPLLRSDLRRCLAGEPGQRFASADEIAGSLRTLPRRRRRRKIRRMGLVAASIFLVVVLAVWSRSAFRRRSMRDHYHDMIVRADNSIMQHRFDDARELLAECPPDMRGWEWGRLQHLCHLELLTLQAHRGKVNSIAFRPDGRRFVTSSIDRLAKIWDAGTGEALVTLKGHDHVVNSAAFSPDGRRVVTASRDNTARIWNAETGDEILTLGGHKQSVRSARFSPDGRNVVTAESAGGAVTMWNADSGDRIRTFQGHSGAVNRAVFDPDGQRLLTASGDQTAKTWEVESGREILSLKGHEAPVVAAVFSPDGRRIVTASEDGTARIWDAASGSEYLTLEGHAETVTDVAFSPDGRRVLTTSLDRTAKIWDAQTGREILTLEGPARVLQCGTFSPDGRYVLLGSGSSRRGEALKCVWAWDTQRDRKLLTLKVPRRLTVLAFRPDGRFIATGGDDGTVQIWDAETGQRLLVLKGHLGPVSSAAFSPDGRRIVTGGDDSSAVVWDAKTGQNLLPLQGHIGRVACVAFSPDGRRVLTGGEDSTANVWDVETGKQLFTLQGHSGRINATAFNPDGERVLTGGGEDEMAIIWNVRTGRRLLALKRLKDWVRFVRFSPDGRRVVVGGYSQEARIYDTRTGRKIRTLKTKRGAISPDFRRAMKTMQRVSGAAWIVDAETGRQLLSLQGASVSSRLAAFSPEGRRVAAVNPWEGVVGVWDALPWRDEDLPGDADMSCGKRIRLYQLEQWKTRWKEWQHLDSRVTTGTATSGNEKRTSDN